MARIEKGTPMKQEMDAMKSDVVKAVKKGTRTRHPIRGCAILLIIGMLLVVFWIVWSLAATGLFSVPVISSLAYRVPEPTRMVLPGIPVETVMQDSLSAQMATRASAGNDLSEAANIQFSLSEGSLTATLQSVMKEAANSQLLPQQAQVAVIEGEGLEVFLPLANNEKESAVTLLLALQANEGEVIADVRSVHVGSFRLPSWMRVSFIEPLIDSGLREMNDRLASYAQIDSIEPKPGALSITGILLEHAVDFPPL
jgi:ABC-type multidrug transport system fused ATPase/permease subunit